MNIELGWLEEFVDLTGWSAEKISTVLTDLGLEVEHVNDPSSMFHRFVIGTVVTCEKHPKADKLSVCTVDAGEGTLRTIVCGAPNVTAGQTVVVALDGAVVPNGGFTIEPRKLRGVESNGMLCSATELNLGEDGSGIIVLDKSHKPGTPFHVACKLDTVFEVAITPNRADCLSHIGMARELHAYTSVQAWQAQGTHDGQQPFPKAAVNYDCIRTTSANKQPAVAVEIHTPHLAPQYSVQRITGVKNGPSPEWMQQRLRAVGLRPRNLVIDVTNYVNMELGQPLHAFDTTKLAGTSIHVSTASDATEFVTLDGKTRTLDSEMLMICDAEKPIAIAGVMGGANSEIEEGTTDIAIESALFNARSIRRTARKLGISTDASYRFERGVDPNNVLIALDRATQLIVEHAGGVVHERTTVVSEQHIAPTITVRFNRMREINGITITNEAILFMLAAIGCTVTETTQEACTLTPPSWRNDITSEIDLAEEVMRLYGVNNIPEATTAPARLDGSGLNTSLQASGGRDGMAKQHAMQVCLTARGYSTVMGTVLSAPLPNSESNNQVTLRNALGLEFSALRMSLIPGMLAVVAHNVNHGATTIRLAEFGNVFQQNTHSLLGVQQEEHLVLAVYGTSEEQWNTTPRPLDFYDVLNDLEATLGIAFSRTPIANETSEWSMNSATLTVGNTQIGTIGLIQPQFGKSYQIDGHVYAAQVNLNALRSLSEIKPTYKSVSPFPTVRRDVAFVVEEKISAAELQFVVEQVAAPAYLGAFIFDVFRDEKQIGAGQKSVGIALKFGLADRTLVDTDVETSVQSIVAAIEQRLGATLRGTV